MSFYTSLSGLKAAQTDLATITVTLRLTLLRKPPRSGSAWWKFWLS